MKLLPSHSLARGGASLARRMRSKGVLALDGVFDRALIEAAHAQFFAHYGDYSGEQLQTAGLRVGDERYMLPIKLSGAFEAPELLRNSRLHDLLSRLLGPDFVLDSVSVVTAYPGAALQHRHADHPELFGGSRLEKLLPPHAITASIPLVSLNDKLRGTAIWCGSHRRPLGWCSVRELRPSLGGLGLIDYRVHHAGAPNLGHTPRPILYVVYARPWFRDSVNFERHPRLNVSERSAMNV